MDIHSKELAQCKAGSKSPKTPLQTATIKEEETHTYVSPIIVTVQHNAPSSSEKLCISLPSQSSSPGSVCRICHDADKNGMLVCPCDCIGTLGLIHITCLEKWLSASNTDRCEICKFRFKISRKSKSLWEWLKSGDNMGPRAMIGDLLCLALLTPLSLVSVYLCSFGALVYMNHGAWEGSGLAVLGCFLLTAFILWCVVTARYHWKLLKEWQRRNQTVQLILAPHQKSLNEHCGMNQVSTDANTHNTQTFEMSVFV